MSVQVVGRGVSTGEKKNKEKHVDEHETSVYKCCDGDAHEVRSLICLLVVSPVVVSTAELHCDDIGNLCTWLHLNRDRQRSMSMAPCAITKHSA